MTRVEEIKERLELLQNAQTIKQANIQKVWLEEHVLSNTRNLLSRLEIAEKALENAKEKTALAVNKMCGGSVKRHIFEETRSAYYAINEALQQIRS